MAFIYPLDTIELEKERKSYQALFYKMDLSVWAVNGSDKTDHGMDYEFEYIENREYKGYRVYSQVKSTEHIKSNEKEILFDLKIKTANYAVSCAQPFLLFVVDLVSDTAYYTCLQDYFINNPNEFVKLGVNHSTIRIKIPVTNIVNRQNKEITEIAKCQYSLCDGRLVQTR